MAHNVVTGILITERSRLLAEQAKMNEAFETNIRLIEAAIEQFSGKKFWEIPTEVLYDDISPDYIKGSQEEI